MKRTTAILYSTALCNLKCTYCFFNKNPALKAIDEIIANSFADENYYFNFIQEYFPHRGDLEKLEIWGGETFLRMERIYGTLHKLIVHYPFFRNFFASTNFSYPEWTDKVFDLLAQFGKYPERRFNVSLQLSLDGPEHITDLTRGKGTTEKCLENYHLLLDRADEIPENVNLGLGFKPTLSVDTMYMLDTKDKLIDYYQFFDELIDSAHRVGNPRLSVNAPIPNLGVPVPAGKKDGEFFTQLVKNCRELERENMERHYFQYYQEITPFSTNVRPKDEWTYNYPCFNCGTGSQNIGFLPNGLISSCHSGFTDLLEDYERCFILDPNSSIDGKTFKSSHNKFTHTKEDYAEYERQVQFYNCEGSMCRLGCLAGFIRTLAIAGEIEEKYGSEEGALRGAELFQSCTCNCLRDNYMVTGSTSLPPEGMIKLLLNGAIDYIMEVQDDCNCT